MKNNQRKSRSTLPLIWNAPCFWKEALLPCRVTQKLHKTMMLHLLTAIFAFVATTSVSLAAGRVALVIGNDRYLHAKPLTSCKNDADDVASALRSVGFEVQLEKDVKAADFARSFEEFINRSKDANAVLFYFAGHGIESRGIGDNFLLPIDCLLEKETDLKMQAYSVKQILADLSELRAPVRIVVLDSCRNNPLQNQAWAANVGTGLGNIEVNQRKDPPMVVYSASPGMAAKDQLRAGDRNSPFAAEFVRVLNQSGINAWDTFVKVTAEVKRTTEKDGMQEPKVVFNASSDVYSQFIFRSSIIGSDEDYLKYAGKMNGEVKSVTVAEGMTIPFCWCPPGYYIMGSPESEKEELKKLDETMKIDAADELPHKVEFKRGFWVAQTELTQRQWSALMHSTIVEEARQALIDDTRYQLGDGNEMTIRELLPRKRDIDPMGIVPLIDDQAPMYWVSHKGASEWCIRANDHAKIKGWTIALPSEAQWEYACRAGSPNMSYDGNFEPDPKKKETALIDQIAWYQGNSHEGFPKSYSEDWKAGPQIVGRKRPNKWGLHDMIGNTWEWCADWHAPYDTVTVQDPKGPRAGSMRVRRGGSWISKLGQCRAAYRGRSPEGFRFSDLGFRPAIIPNDVATTPAPSSGKEIQK